jgi:hypothetical protein
MRVINYIIKCLYFIIACFSIFIADCATADTNHNNYSYTSKNKTIPTDNVKPFGDNFVSNIFIGTIGSLLAICIQIIWIKTSIYYKYRTISLFWAVNKKPLIIVHPIYHNELGEPISEDLARMEIVYALNIIINFFNQNKIQYVVQSDNKPLPADSDIILISSPKGNRHSQNIYSKLTLPFEIIKQQSTFIYRDRSSSISYESPVDKCGEKTDIGLVARINDIGSNRKIYLLWGIHLIGTVSAVKYVTNPNKLKNIKNLSKGNNLTFLVQSKYNNGLDVGEPNLITQL